MIPKGWEEKELSEVCVFKSGGTPNKNNSKYWDGDIPWITAKDMKSLELSDSLLKITEDGANNGASLIDKDTLLILVRGMTLKKEVPICIATKRMAFNQDVKALVAKGIDPRYLAYYLTAQSRKIQNLVDEAGHGTGRLQTDLLGSFPVLIPPREEQHRFSTACDLLTEAISCLENIIKRKISFQEGIKQQLLLGKRRLPKYGKSKQHRIVDRITIPEDWKYPALENLANEISVKNSMATKLPVLSCTKHHGLIDSLDYFGKQIFSKDLSTYKIIEARQFSYATNHIEEGSIGYQDIYDRALVSPMYTVFETKGDVDDQFLFLLLKTERYRRIFESKTNASVNRRGSLRWSAFSKIHIPLPSLEEQHAIVAALNLFKREIMILKQELAALKRQKAGLMQRFLKGDFAVHTK